MYQKMLASDKEHMERQQQTVEELRLSIAKYWVMAVSANQRLGKAFDTWIADCQQQQSDYNWSAMWIIMSQFSVMGPTIVVVKFIFDCVTTNRIEFTIESYWTEKLMEWRQSSIPIKIKKGKVKKILYKIKSLILTFCILVQTVVVVISIVSSYSMLPLVLLVNHFGKLFHKNEVPNDQGRPEVHLNCFVILLEGEKQFPNRILRKIINNVDTNVEMGKMQQPQNLFNLLNQSFSFSGVVEFDSNRVPSLLSDEPPNCWTLPVVTLASIAIALPNIAILHIDWLVTSVDEGLHYASIIDVLDEKCGLKSIKSVADVWVGVELHKKWFDMNLERKIGEVRSAKEIILALANEAERVVMEFSSTKNRIIVENPLYWPSNILAANSMYRISRTILLHYENSECQVEELFRKLICLIADILTACLTNLPHLIATKCICNAIEKREKSVRHAAIILGETEDILKCFEKRKLSNMGPRQPLCIDEWRQWIERHAPTISTSATSNGVASSDDESSKPVVIQMQA
ncbi:uncharacterized protein LOC116028009 [Ipomoea triloba]|uniref:uncharacterized protein LOC116028009 n=1 Tax=Ipomoea triloba TaxID=35885 RepID=UPI00125E3486|nr:uncharacterized protein LOC116028009 [Ipomoea triloba]